MNKIKSAVVPFISLNRITRATQPVEAAPVIQREPVAISGTTAVSTAGPGTAANNTGAPTGRSLRIICRTTAVITFIIPVIMVSLC